MHRAIGVGKAACTLSAPEYPAAFFDDRRDFLTCINVTRIPSSQIASRGSMSSRLKGRDKMDSAELVYLCFAVAAFVTFAVTLFFVTREDATHRDGQFVKDAYPANENAVPSIRHAA
jgi:hypothetical protein